MKNRLLSNRYESVELKVRVLLFFVDIAGGFIFSVMRMFKGRHEKYEPEKVKKILIFRLDGLGDVVLSTAALKEIRNGFPGARITLVVGAWSKDIVKCIHFYDRLIVLKRVIKKFHPDILHSLTYYKQSVISLEE